MISFWSQEITMPNLVQIGIPVLKVSAIKHKNPQLCKVVKRTSALKF